MGKIEKRLADLEKAIKPDPPPKIYVCWCCDGYICDYHQAHPDAEDGIYWIAPDDGEAFEVRCDMTIGDGGWTMIASFNNEDGTYHWTRFGSGPNSIGNWRNRSTFGDLAGGDTAHR